MGKENDNIDFKIKVTSPQDFEITLTMQATATLFNRLFTEAMQKIGKEKGVSVVAGTAPDFIDRFPIHEQYYNFTKQAIKKAMKDINKQTSKKGIVLISYFVSRGEFVKEGDLWNIKINVSGIYDDRRHKR